MRRLRDMVLRACELTDIAASINKQFGSEGSLLGSRKATLYFLS